MRTGIMSFVQPYAANELGGAQRGLPLFAADVKAGRKEGHCTKHQHAHGALSPGLMVMLQAVHSAAALLLLPSRCRAKLCTLNRCAGRLVLRLQARCGVVPHDGR